MTAFPTSGDTVTLAPASQQTRDLALVIQTAIEHHRNQEYDEAAALYASVLEAQNDHPDAHYNLGVLLMQTGKPSAAVQHFEAVLGQAPKNGQVWIYYINALIASEQTEAANVVLKLAQQQGLPDSTVQALRARINGEELPPPVEPTASAPEDAVSDNAPPPASGETETETETEAEAETEAETEAEAPVKANIRRPALKELRQYQHLFNNGKLDAALAVARRLTERYPAHGESWYELGRVLHRLGHHAQAIEAGQQAARFLPARIDIHITLSNWMYTARQYRQVEAQCRQLLEKFPESAALHRNLGLALLDMGGYAEGIGYVRRAVELAPNSGLEHDALANSLLKQGLYEEADVAFRRALELMPMESVLHSNMLFCRMHKYDLDANTAFAELREFGERHEAQFRARPPRHTNDRDPSRRLKLGFVSGDLVNHPVAYFFLSVLEHLARDPGLSIHIYSSYSVADSFTGRIRVHAQTWDDVSGLTYDALAEKIREDRIDILVDLAGHTGRNRLVTFARKPAPVQVSWIGNPCTTGLETIDYYLSDRFVTPLEQFENLFSEKLVFLPALAPFKPEAQAPAVNALPALKNGYFTFGSFSRIIKIGPEVVALWARVLREVPNSRMVIGAIASHEQIAKLVTLFTDEGVDMSRLTFLPRTQTIEPYLRQHHLMDVCLDTFPFGNSTTTMQALWMGVPTMTLPGVSMASRSSTGWLTHLGLDAAFVAQDKDDFVRKCVALAADPQALAVVRQELREYCRNSVLIDARAISDAASRAFRIMWQRWCNKLKPEHFEVLVEARDTAAPDSGHEPQPEVVESVATLPNHVYQIYYSDETRRQIEPDFLPLDNTGLRPDWREYWPMRRFLLEEKLDPNARYGFLSPRFAGKTGLAASDVHAFLKSVPDDVDVVTFSPFFDQGALPLNVFEHAAVVHPGVAPVINDVLKIIAPGIKAGEIIMSSVETVFCNYLVAKPAFWAQWLQLCEQIFALAEAGDTPLAERLNGEVEYARAGIGAAPSKVFIIERIASLILATQPQWKVRQFNPFEMNMSGSPVARFRNELIELDALKHMAKTTGFGQYLEAFRDKSAQLHIRLRDESRSETQDPDEIAGSLNRIDKQAASAFIAENETPLFSIIIPTHQRPRLLRRALQSVKSQPLSASVEVLVVADTRDTATDAVCKEMLSATDRYLKRTGKPGPAESRNLALEQAKGRYVLFLDDDDALHPGLLAQLQSNPLVQAGEPVYFNCTVVHELRSPEHTETLREAEIDQRGRLTEDVFIQNQLPLSCFAFPIKLLDGIRFDSYMRAYEDWEFLLAFFERQMPTHIPVLGPRVHEVPEGPSDRRGSSRGAHDHNAVLDHVYVYRRRPAPNLALKEKRAELMRQVANLTIPPDML